MSIEDNSNSISDINQRRSSYDVHHFLMSQGHALLMWYRLPGVHLWCDVEGACIYARTLPGVMSVSEMLAFYQRCVERECIKWSVVRSVVRKKCISVAQFRRECSHRWICRWKEMHFNLVSDVHAFIERTVYVPGTEYFLIWCPVCMRQRMLYKYFTLMWCSVCIFLRLFTNMISIHKVDHAINNTRLTFTNVHDW